MKKLLSILKRIGGRGYPAYKDLKGRYQYEFFELEFDYIQGDPFASPSRLIARVAAESAGWPEHFLSSSIRREALADYLARRVRKSFMGLRSVKGSGKSGRLSIDAGGQEILERTSCMVHEDGSVEVRFFAGLPAFGRKIAGYEAEEMLIDQLKESLESTLLASANDLNEIENWYQVAEDQEALREGLGEKSLIAFIADGAVLPRASGVSDLPLQGESSVVFRSPDSLAVELECPNRGKVRGMGIRKGVTLIIGGGFHGKSTLMHAVERGVYNHIPGDGREYVVTDYDALKVRAEDGRYVEKVNISGFISDLPVPVATECFSTENASGSTSQAASIMEGVEAGASALLLDEDTCATNFMIRDERMQTLVVKENEPITPLIDQIESIRDLDISLVLVMGGCGDYLDEADTVICMNRFLPEDYTEEAKRVCEEHPARRDVEKVRKFGCPEGRNISGRSFPVGMRGGSPKVRVKGKDEISYEKELIELGALEQLVDGSQTRTLAEVLQYLHHQNSKQSVVGILEALEDLFTEKGVRGISQRRLADLAYVRPLEVACMLNRYRGLKVE